MALVNTEAIGSTRGSTPGWAGVQEPAHACLKAHSSNGQIFLGASACPRFSELLCVIWGFLLPQSFSVLTVVILPFQSEVSPWLAPLSHHHHPALFFTGIPWTPPHYLLLGRTRLAHMIHRVVWGNRWQDGIWEPGYSLSSWQAGEIPGRDNRVAGMIS